MAAVFSKSKMAAVAILNYAISTFYNFAFMTSAPNQSSIVYTNFGDDRSNPKEMAAVFRNSSRHLESTLPVEPPSRAMNS